MRWEDERYVRVYTRDTTDWLALSFDAQALFLMLLRKVDRAGLLPLGKHGKRGAAIAVGHPQNWERIAPAFEELLADGCVTLTSDGTRLLVPNFLAAQEARASDKARQSKSRELDRDTAAAESVTPRDTPSRLVTECHTPSHAVTGGHATSQIVTPSLAVPCLAVPSRAEDLPPASRSVPEQATLLPGVNRPKPRKAKAEAPGDPRHKPLLDALYDAGWTIAGGRGAKAVTNLLARADEREATSGTAAPAEVLRRAAIARSRTSFPLVRELVELESKWTHFESDTGLPNLTKGSVRAELMDHTKPQEPF